MKITSLLDVLHASVHTWLVQSPWAERGGILITAPAGQLKTTLIYTLEIYPEVCCTSDINIRSMKSLRDMVLGGKYRTIAFGELEKLYARNPATAANIESHLKQFVEEGLRHFSHEDSAVPIMPARCLVIAGLTPSMMGKMFTIWNDSGFLRRFLRIQYVLRNEKALLDAVHEWKKVSIEMHHAQWNGRINISYNLDEQDSKFVMSLMKEQQHTTPTVLMKRIAVILKSQKKKDWRRILTDFAPALGKNGAFLEL